MVTKRTKNKLNLPKPSSVAGRPHPSNTMKPWSRFTYPYEFTEEYKDKIRQQRIITDETEPVS